MTMWHLNQIAVAVVREHADDLLRQAQHQRALREARRAPGLYRSAMLWLARWLVAWGWRLRVRHGTIEFREDAGTAHRLCR
jgi:hypothetical protein